MKKNIVVLLTAVIMSMAILLPACAETASQPANGGHLERVSRDR